MIFANYILKCADARSADEISEILSMVIRRVQYSRGCIQSELWKSKDNYKFMVSEIWKTKTDFDRYVNSTLFKRLLAAMEMSSEKPEIKISESENIRGIELIEEVMKPVGIIPD
jgi:quinol monooxygenase YgiN